MVGGGWGGAVVALLVRENITPPLRRDTPESTGAISVELRTWEREKSLQGGSSEGAAIHWKADNKTISQITGTKLFSFDRVFDENETTQTVYNEVAHSIVCSITQGYNGTIFAYGQTSSGKTYTMMGNANAPGIIPLAICNLFKVINDMPNREFLLRVSYMEIYNESVSDLLSDSKGRSLEVREAMEGMIYVADLTEEVAVTYEDVMQWVKKGEKNRHYGETRMNERSSRSHTIFRVIVESRDKNNEAFIVSHLNLVDLAGSERASQTGAEGVRLKEGCNINRSLFVLGQVIKKLTDGQAGFLNYRDSKLTRILQNSLGGNARTLIICAITPAAFEETLSTLQFASTAKFMKNTPHVNEVLDNQAMLKRYRKEIMNLKNQMKEEKAQLLSENYHLQQEHEKKLKNLRRMLVRVPHDEDINERIRKKRRYTWAPGKERIILNSTTDNTAKVIKLDQAFPESEEIQEDFPDEQQPNAMSECSSKITLKRGGSSGYLLASFEDFSPLDQSRLSQCSLTSVECDESLKDELDTRISELNKDLERKEIENMPSKFDAKILKMENENENCKEEIRELKELLEKKQRDEKYLRMENENQNCEIQELKKLRDRFEALKERREIEEFEFFEKQVVKEDKAAVNNKTKELKDQEQRLDQLKELLGSQVDLETLTMQLKQLQQSLKDAEVVTCDAKKESAFLRSENLELKETMNEMRLNYQRMEKDVQLYSTKLNTEQTRHKEMQSDLQKELKYFYSENVKLMSLLDGKVPKDILDRVYLEKSIADLQQQLVKVEKENASLQQEVIILSQNKLLPEKVDELEKQVLRLTEELNERDNLLMGREENDEQLEKMQRELSHITEERDKLQEAKFSFQQENLKVEQQNEMQSKMEGLKMELELCCTHLEEERAKCSQLQHNTEDKAKQIKELEQQMMLELVKQKEMDDKFSEVSVNIKLLNEEKEELMTKIRVLTKTNEELAMSQPKSQKGEERQNVSTTAEMQNLTEQLQIQKYCKAITDEKEKLHKELSSLQNERDQLKCDLNDNIEMCIENQAELRSLHDQLKMSQNVEMELKTSLAEKEYLINEEKEKMQNQAEELHHLNSQRKMLLDEIERLKDHICKEQEVLIKEEEFRQQFQQLKDEKSALVKEKDELEERLKCMKEEKDEMTKVLQENSELTQKQGEELHHTVSQRDELLGEIEELRARDSKEQETDIQKKEFNQQFQQLEDEKSSLIKERDELNEKLRCVVEKDEIKKALQKNSEMVEDELQELKNVIIERDEMKRTLQENCEIVQNQAEKLHHVSSQRDVLLDEIEKLKNHICKEQEVLIKEEEFRQQFQQLEDEKSALVKEKDELEKRLKCMKEEKDEMTKVLQENSELTQKQGEELHHTVSQRDELLGEIEELRARDSKEQETDIQKKEFIQQFQQLEDEKSSLIKERDELSEKLRCVVVEKDEIKKALQKNSEMVEDELQELKNVIIERDEMKRTLQENCEIVQNQAEKLHHVSSQRDVLLDEIEKLKDHICKEQEVLIKEEEFRQQFQQLEDEKSALVKEKDELEERLKCMKEEKDEMTKVLQENSELTQKQGEELHHTVSQRDELLGEIEELRARDSKEQEKEIQKKEFIQQFQQLEDEKSSLIKERDELNEKLRCVVVEKDEIKKALQENSEMVEDELQELKNVIIERDEMKRTLQENCEIVQNQAEKLHHVSSQRDVLLDEIEKLKDHICKEQEVLIKEEEFRQQFQQLEDEKSALVKEKDELEERLKCMKEEKDEMTKVLQENSELTQKQGEELHHTVSQRDELLGEIEELRARDSKEQETDIQKKEFIQQFQQLEDEKSSLIKERDELNEKLRCVVVEKDEIKKALQENSEMTQNQGEELHHIVSQRDELLAEIEELRAHDSKEQEAEIQKKEFIQQFQQLEDEKSSLIKERDELNEKLRCVVVEKDEIKKALQENSEMTQNQGEELHHIVSQRDKLLAEINELRAHGSKEQGEQICKEEFIQSFQQLENEKLFLIKERAELQERLESIKAEKDETKRALMEKTEMMQKQVEELGNMISQRDVLLVEVEDLRALASKVPKAEIQEVEFNQQFQRLANEKLSILKEKDDLEEKLKNIKAERDKMKKTLEANIEMMQNQDEKLEKVMSQRNTLRTEIEELKTRASKEQKAKIQEEKFIQQLENEKLSIMKEKNDLQELLACVKLENEMKRTLQEKLKMEERNEIAEMDPRLEKQIVKLKGEQMQTETTDPRSKEINAEILKLSNHLQEKDNLLQEVIQNLIGLEKEYKMEVAETDSQLSREGEAWNELLLKFCSKFPEESTESISIKKLQEENKKLYEQFMWWRYGFMCALCRVCYNVMRYQVPITNCDLDLANEKKRNTELCMQLQTLKKQISDSPLQELASEEKKPELLRLSTLIEYKENHLKDAQQILSELKLKYENYLISTKKGLSSKAKAQKVFVERISLSSTNASATIEEIEHEMQLLNRDLQLQIEVVKKEAVISETQRTGYVKYIRNSANELANAKKKNEELLLEIETFKQQTFSKSGCDPILDLENQKLKEKLKTDEQLLQKMEIKINELEMALTTSQEANKHQEDKVKQLQTELNSKTLENKLEDLQSMLLKKDNKINRLQEDLKQLQAKLDVGAQPFKEVNELKNRLFTLEIEKVKECKSLENQISSLKRHLEHKEELLRQVKETSQRYQQQQDTTIMGENSEMSSTDASLTCRGGSGIVQNALILVLKSDNAKLNQDINHLKKENARITKTVSDLKYENTKWKDRALKLKEKERTLLEHQRESVSCILTPNQEESNTACSFTGREPVSQKVETSKELFPLEVKTLYKLDAKSLPSEKILPAYSSTMSSVGSESKWQLPHSKIFDNSQLGFLEAQSPKRKPEADENVQDDWWPKASAPDSQCKMQ
ncbi:centromere-associated protein E isoform X2 [Narcine bancroftii]|uniref:centromere-associated protein E isoform X2 n=1 Tax=Narcine bancroftii TaxID=1343680 RepID=UPI0038318A4D